MSEIWVQCQEIPIPYVPLSQGALRARTVFLASLTRTCQKNAVATDPSFLANFPTSQPHFLADSFLTAHFVVQVPIRSEACQSRRRVQSKSNRATFIIWLIALVALLRGGTNLRKPPPQEKPAKVQHGMLTSSTHLAPLAPRTSRTSHERRRDSLRFAE